MHCPLDSLNALPSLVLYTLLYCGFVFLLYLNNPNYSGPIQWARGDVGLKPSAAARPGDSPRASAPTLARAN